MSKNKLYIIYFVLISILSHIHAQINVACIGNSITQGSGLLYNENYPYQLGVRLGGNYEVENFGEGSRIALRIPNDWSYFDSPVWQYSRGSPHDVVIILFGTNDSKDVYRNDYWHFKADYLDLMDGYKNYPNYEDPVFVLGLPPPVFDESSSHNNENIVNDIIPMIKQIADETDAIIADFYNALDGQPELFIDGVHPNAVGAGIMAEVAYDAIQRALSSEDPPPDTPTGLKTIPGLANINLEWHANTEDDLWLYSIHRSDEMGGFQNYIGNVLKPDTTFSDNDVELNHIYYYSIDARDVHNNISSRTVAVAGKTLDNTPPVAPTNLQVTQEPDTIKLTWAPNIEVDLLKYNIYRNIIDIQSASTIIGTVNAPENNFIDISYNSATNYYYGVTAVDISGNQGAMSNIVNIITVSPPVSSDTTLTVIEDTPLQFSSSDIPFSDLDNHQLDKMIFIDSDHFEYFTYDGDSIKTTITCDDVTKLLFRPDLDDFGENYAEFSFKVVDSFGNTNIDTNKVTINVASVNDAPHVDPLLDLYLMEDSHNILLPITGINAGPSNELQNISVKAYANLVDASNIEYNSPDNSGLIILDPLENVFGIISVTIQIIDDGGSFNGGIDTFSTTFNMHISPINDPPTFNLIDNIQMFEDSEAYLELVGIQAGLWETDQHINITVHSNNTDILPHPELNYSSPDTFANLAFSTISNMFGSSSITIVLSDNGGTDFGGKDSTTYIIPIEITSVNDKPGDFNIITPISDSTLVINKANYLNTFLISWEPSSDIENDSILYNIIFKGNFSVLSRYGINSTSTEYILKDILSLTDTISIANSAFSISATDGYLETDAINGDITLTVDGRSFAPAKLHLDQNYPNPFNHTTVIGFDLPNRANISIIIYDLLGEEVVKLINNKKYERGYSTITWNGLDKNNNLITAGIYIMQISMGSHEQHKKFIYIK